MKSFAPLFLAIATTLTGADLSGIVVAEHDGSPVVAAAITFRAGGNVVAEVETDDAGKFRAPNLPAAEYTVSATKTSFTAAEQRVALTESKSDLVLQITKLGVISGRVTDNQGNAVRNFVVSAVPATPENGGPIRVYNARPKGAVTDSAGRYRIFGLTAGDYAVLALAGNARNIANITNGVTVDTSHGSTADFYPSSRSPATLSIRKGEEHTGIDFKGYTGPLFTLRGTVSGPSPESAYRVSLVAEVAGIPLGNVLVQPGKEFQFDRVAPGTYKIVAVRQVQTPVDDLLNALNSGQIVVSSANEAEFIRELQARSTAETKNPTPRPEPVFAETIVTVTRDLPGITLSARPGVTAKLIYQPAKDCPTSVQLTLNPVDYLGVGSNNRKLEAGIEAPVTGIPSAAYDVSLNLPESSGCYAATTTIDFRQISTGTAVPIVVATTGKIQGKVDSKGYAAGEFTIALITPEGVTKRTLALSKESTFEIPNLRPGRYRVTITRRSQSRVVAAEQTLTVETGATAQIEFPVLP